MRDQLLPLFGRKPHRFERRSVPGFVCGDRVRWITPKPPSRAMVGKIIGYACHCTKLVIRTSDDLLLTLAPEEVINTTRRKTS